MDPFPPGLLVQVLHRNKSRVRSRPHTIPRGGTRRQAALGALPASGTSGVAGRAPRLHHSWPNPSVSSMA